MASGPEHFQEAERLLDMAGEIPARDDDTNPGAALTIAEAQVHATLALAAATALMPGTQQPDWWQAAGPSPEEEVRRFTGGTGPRGQSTSYGPGLSRLLRDVPRPVTHWDLVEGRQAE